MIDSVHDLVLDACLEEVVGGIQPPDLTERIMQSWSAVASTSSAEPAVASADGARAGQPLPPPGQEPPAPPVQPTTPSPRPVVRNEPSLSPASRQTLPWIPLTVAASLLIAVGWIGYLSVTPANNQPVEIARGDRQQSDERPATDAAEPPGADRMAADSPSPLGFGRRADSPMPHSQDASGAQASVDGVAHPPLRLDRRLSADDGSVEDSSSVDTELVSYVNGVLASYWDEHNVTPSPKADDAHWCRRTYLRILGRIPIVAELNRYIASSYEDKAARLIDTLLGSNEYADEYARNWTTVWTNLLVGRSGGMQAGSMVSREGMQQYLHASLRQNKPYDRLVYELISATGATRPGSRDFNGAVNALIADVDERAIRATAKTARVFLGVSLQCNQCHDHPFNDSTQHQFWQLNAFFRQARAAGNGKTVRLVDRDFAGEGKADLDEAGVFYERRNGLVKVAYPGFLDGTSTERSGRVRDVRRRARLAQLVVDSDEMSRAIINRVWAHFMGYGFTKPVDDLGPHNQPSHPEILERLSQQFVASGYDLKRLMRWIALSDAFARSSVITEGSRADDPDSGLAPLFSRYYLRQLKPEEVYESLIVAANVQAPLDVLAQRQKTKGEWMQQFVIAEDTDEGGEQVMFNGSVHQVLTMMNGPLMKRATSMKKGGFLHTVVRSKMTPPEKINHLFLAALGRTPTPEEIQTANRLLVQRRGDVSAILQDVWWALLNSNEFILDH